MLWLVRNSAPARTMRRFRLAQTASAAAMALGHGLQDAQKTMGVIMLALIAGGFYDQGDAIPLWVKLSAATAISLGTYSGGWRIMRTLGRKIIELDPARGFVAESVAASVLYASAYWLHAPISTTHTITSAIMGVGATKRLSAVRWGVAKNIGVAWVLTIPMAALGRRLRLLDPQPDPDLSAIGYCSPGRCVSVATTRGPLGSARRARRAPAPGAGTGRVAGRASATLRRACCASTSTTVGSTGRWVHSTASPVCSSSRSTSAATRAGDVECSASVRTGSTSAATCAAARVRRDRADAARPRAGDHPARRRTSDSTGTSARGLPLALRR